MLAEFAEALAGLTWNEPVIPVVSNVTGKLADPGQLTDPAYWVEHVRRPVRFADGISSTGGSVFLELGPGGALSGAIAESAGDDAVSALPCGTSAASRTPFCRPWRSSSYAEPRSTGRPCSPEGATEAHVDLPTYAFEHQDYWLPAPRPLMDAIALGQGAADHPLLGAVVPLPQSGWAGLHLPALLRTHPWLARPRHRG